LSFRDYNQTHRIWYESFLYRPSQDPLPDNKQHSQQTNIRAPRRIQARNSSKREVVDPHLSTVLRLIIRGTMHRHPLFPSLAYTAINSVTLWPKLHCRVLKILQHCGWEFPSCWVWLLGRF